MSIRARLITSGRLRLDHAQIPQTVRFAKSMHANGVPGSGKSAYPDQWGGTNSRCNEVERFGTARNVLQHTFLLCLLSILRISSEKSSISPKRASPDANTKKTDICDSNEAKLLGSLL